MSTLDERTELPESSVKRPKPFDSARKLRQWGIDREAPANAPDEPGPAICKCKEDGCVGRWRLLDRSGPVWIVECDACGFETGIPPQDKRVRAAERLARSGVPERFIGLMFEEDTENRNALMLLRSWLRDFEAEQQKGEEGSPGIPALAVWGDPGVGKTHLLAALCVRLIREREVGVMFRSVSTLLRELQRFDDEVQRTDTWERALSIDVLALDDLGAERITDWRLEQLADLIDARYLAELPILLTTNYPPKAWDEILDERSSHRLLVRRMVLPVQLRGRDRRQEQLPEVK